MAASVFSFSVCFGSSSVHRYGYVHNSTAYLLNTVAVSLRTAELGKA